MMYDDADGMGEESDQIGFCGPRSFPTADAVITSQVVISPYGI